jgi:hypothetical protein
MPADDRQAARTLTTIRMRRRKNGDAYLDLDGYIFGDEDHARRWLQQPFVGRSTITLERVVVSKDRVCPHCKGTGSDDRTAKVIGKMTVDEFLEAV